MHTSGGPVTFASLELWKSDLARRLDAMAHRHEDVFVIVAEIDAYERLIAEHGNQAGFALTEGILRAWKSELTHRDSIVLYGNSCFAIVLAGYGFSNVLEVVEKLRARVPSDHTISAGVVVWNRAQLESAASVFARAQFELAEAKEDGVDQLRVGPWLRPRAPGSRRPRP